MFKDKNFQSKRPQRPDWLKVKAPIGDNYTRIRNMMRAKALHTVCEEAHCPNIGECWGLGTATFMILGDICSRSCGFCAIGTGKPKALDMDEPKRVAESVKKMNLKHAVVTSVNRDELPDGGSQIWYETILEIRKLNPNTSIEVLIPDFKGDKKALKTVFTASPDILNHNVETAPRLYKIVRPQANYQQSLDVLKYASDFGLKTKSGLMVGIGETNEEVIEVLQDLIEYNVKIVTIGQYLQPTKKHLPVDRFVTPDEFAEYKRIGLELGFDFVESAPLVRSSYHAAKHV